MTIREASTSIPSKPTQSSSSCRVRIWATQTATSSTSTTKPRYAPLRFDLAKRAVGSDSQVIADQVGYQPSISWGTFSVSENGTIVYNATLGATLSVLTWYDRAGKELGHVGDIGVVSNPTLSPDGSRVAIDIADAKANDVNIWLGDLNRGTNSRFTFDTTEDVGGVWSRDGTMIAYRSLQPKDTNLFLKQAQGLQPPRLIFSVSANGHPTDDLIPNSWSPDDKLLLATLQAAAGGSQLVLIQPSSGKMTPFLSTVQRVQRQISVQRVQRPDFSRRQMGGLRIERIGRLGGLRHHISHRHRKMASVPRRRHRASLARRWKGNFLHWTQEHANGGHRRYP